MTKRIFRSICFAALSVFLAALALILGALYNYFTDVLAEQLRVETALASHAVANEGISYFDRLDDTMDCRITWIAADGNVLYDNRSDSLAMENHLQREEVVNAFSSGYGQSIRYSDTLMERYIYSAELLPDGTVLRLAAAQNSIFTLVLGMARPICLVIAVALVLSLFLASRLSRSIVQPLNDLDLKEPLRNQRYEEIRPLLYRLEYQQTQLRQQSRELSQRQKEFESITRSLAEGLVLLGADRTILSINAAAARLLEVTPNCSGADFMVANRNDGIAVLTDRAFAGEKAEQTMTLPGGEFLVAARPVRSEGVVSGVVLLMLDVTEKRRSEAMRREFTANVSHELKTPLHAISGYAELLGSGMVADKDVTEFAGKIYSEARRMTRLVEDILRLSRLDEGGKDMQWLEADLYALAQETLQTLSGPAELAGVSLELKGEPAVFSCIPQLVSGILFNLADNAVKYNRPGGRVVVQVENTPAGPRLTVTDTGMGIPEEYRDRVFERFFRVDKSHSKAVGGTGLGLSIVKHAAMIHNAGVKLQSTEGRGTTVTVQFPGTER